MAIEEPEADEPIAIAKQRCRDIEQFSQNSYWEPKGEKWTYGYGFTFRPDGTPVQQGDTINLEDSEKRLDVIHQNNLKYINNLPAAKFMNNMHKAGLLDLAFNIGASWNAKKNKSLLEAVGSEKGLKNLPNVLRMYNKSGGKEVPSLTARRETAASGIENYNPSPKVREDPVAPSQKETPVKNKPIGVGIDTYEYDPIYGIRKLSDGSIVSDTRPSER